jgi:hypothetical protein
VSRTGSLLTTLGQHYGTAPTAIQLSAHEAKQLASACLIDADDYWFSGLVSLGEALQGLQFGRYSWAIVKAYYSAFYLSRAVLAKSATAIEYIHWNNRHRHYVWKLRAGQAANPIKGNTHDSVLKYLDDHHFVPKLAGQLIGTSPVWEWLIARRNDSNYTGGRFPDPKPRSCTEFVARNDIRLTVQAYVDDQTLLYAFDPDHAILAFPIELAKSLRDSYSPNLLSEDLSHLNSLFRTKQGPLGAVARSLYS